PAISSHAFRLPADTRWIGCLRVRRSRIQADWVGCNLPSRVAELVRLDDAGRPVEHQQALEVVIAADIVPADATQRSFALPVRVAAEGEGDAGGLAGLKVLHPRVAGEGLI